MNHRTSFDVAVIGRGMLGAAASRHLAEAGASVVMIGPGEPDSYIGTTNPLASHYDEARITRISAADPVWSELAARSMRRYEDIAIRSGIAFHQPTGLVQVSLDAAAAVDSAERRGGQARMVDRGWAQQEYGILIPPDAEQDLLFEEPPAGVISPRHLVAAQTSLATAAGAALIDAPATQIRRPRTGFEITAGTRLVSATRILAATGAYGASLFGVRLATERRLRTVVTAELDATASLPCLIIERPAAAGFDRLYWTPPVRYPNGRMMLKLGASLLPLRTAEHDVDIASWFESGGSIAEAQRLIAALRDLLPDVRITSWDYKPCVMTYTTSGRPFIGSIDEGVVAALGGNGSAAKSSDEIGRLATQAFEGWSDPVLPAASFSPRLQT